MRTNPEKPCTLKCFIPLGDVKDFEEMEDPDNNDELFNFSRWPEESGWNKFIWLLSYPLECIFFLTTPNVQRPVFRECNFVCLLMSMFWITILTYLCSWAITVIGYHLSVPDSVMGLVIVAAGTSVPEAISSVIVTRKGYGSMAICNAVSSNTVNIFFCLGVPWIIKSVLFPTIPFQHAVSIASQGIFYSSGCLLITALLLYISFLVTRFQMNRVLGIMSLFVYIVFVTLSVIVELFFYENQLPHCTHVNNN